MLHSPTLPRLTALLVAIVPIAVLLFVVGLATNAGAQAAPSLGTASSYAVLGASTVTNTGSTTIGGDLGVWPGTAVTGFPPGTVTGTTHAGDANAQAAQGDVSIAYDALAHQSCPAGNDLTGQDLGGLTLTDGVYCFSSSAQLTGQLTLNAQGNAGAVFIFQTGSTLTTASNSSVVITNGGVDCNVFWQVGSSATIGTGTTFGGNILASASITLTTGANVSGRTLAQNGAVTLDTNHVGFEACAASTATASPTASPTASATVTPSPTATAAPTGTATATATSTAAATPTPTAAPVGQTPTPTVTPVGHTPTPTVTPVGHTPTPTVTPVGQTPTPTVTPVGQTPTPTVTPVGHTPTPTATPVGQTPTPHITPCCLPRTGGPLASSGSWWTLLLVALVTGTFGAAVMALGLVGLNVRTHSRRE